LSYFVRQAPKDHLGWLAMRTTAQLTNACRGIEAIDRNGRIVGMVCFDGWTPRGAFAHVAVESPAAVRALLRPAFSWAFGPAARETLFGLIPATASETDGKLELIWFSCD
jgi:hypothetical protein